MRILLAIDGSEQSEAAVDEIAHRRYPPGSEVRVLSVVAPKLDASVITVSDVMANDLVTCREDMGVSEVIHKMRAKGVRRMPIVSERGDLVGVVSVDDVIELLAEELSEVSKLIAREQGREVRLRR